MELFAITCTTCHARLKVRDQAAIGQILACPKCDSMVHVTPPPGWQPVAAIPAVAAGAGHDTVSTGNTIQVPARQFAPHAARVASTAASAPQVAVLPVSTAPPVATAGRTRLAARVSHGASHMARNWLIWTCSPVAAMAIALVAWIVLRPGPVDQVAQAADDANPSAVASTDDAVASDDAAVEPQLTSRESGSGLAGASVAGPAADSVGDEPAIAVAADSSDEPGEGEMPEDTTVASDQPDAAAGDAPAEDGPARSAAAVPAAPRLRSPVDVQARLADPLPRVDFQRVALADICDFLAQMTGVPISLDIDALAAAGVRAGDLVTVRMTDTTVGDVLTAALAERQLDYVVVGQHIAVTSSALRSEEPVTVKYDIRDLAGTSAEEAAYLVGLVTRFVDPPTWQDRGGNGRIAIADGQLIVAQTPLVERHVAALLDALRAARGIATKGTTPRDAIPLATRPSRAKAILEKHVTANFSLETPLSDILSWLSHSTGTRFLIDAGSFAQAGLARDVPATFVANDQSLDQALTALLDPLGCSFRVVDQRTLQVFARRGGAADPLELELYAVSDLLSRGVDGKRLVAYVHEKVEPKSWADAGGAGDIEFDGRGKCLVVRQTPSVHNGLANVLAAVREKAAKGRQ